MKRKNFILALFLLITVFIFSEGEPNQYVEKYKIFTLLPPLVAIILAFVTKNVVISLFVGILTGTYMINLINYNFLYSLFFGFLGIIEKIIGSMADTWNAGIILQVLTIGGLVALISKMGGARAIAEKLSKKAKTPASTQIITWVLGMFIFFDDYANALIIGPIMRPISDKMKISREKLSFVIDATAAPIAGIALVSTWVGYEVSLIKDSFTAIGMENVSAYNIFVSTIPYRFYNILMLLFVVLSAVLLKDFGPMLKAEVRARKTGKVLGDDAKPMVSDEIETIEVHEIEKEDFKEENVIKSSSIWNALIPIVILILGSLLGFYYNGYGYLDGETLEMVKNAPLSLGAIREAFGAADASVVLFQAALLASIVAIIMGVAQKMFKVEEGIETWIHGWKSLIITVVILLLAWSLSSVIKELGAALYLSEILKNSIPKFLLPSIIFIAGSIISFSTGTSYGTMGILMPLAVPLSNSIGQAAGLDEKMLLAYIVVNVSGVLTGAIFGDHCSPISDTTILSSMGAGSDHIAHTRTQIVYALVVATISILFGYIPAGLGVPVFISLPIGGLAVFLVLNFFGKNPDKEIVKN